MAPKHTMVSAAAFQLSTKDVEVYTLFISELADTDPTMTTIGSDSVPAKYQDLHEVFSEKSSNELPNHGVSDMKIKFKEG